MSPEDLRTFLGKPVRLTTHWGGHVEGRLIAYCETPTVQVETAEGRKSLATSVIANIRPVPCSHCDGTGVAQ